MRFIGSALVFEVCLVREWQRGFEKRIGAGAALWERKHRGEKRRKIRREKEGGF